MKNVEKEARKAKSFITGNPVKTATYAVGIGAALSYFLIPRNKNDNN